MGNLGEMVVRGKSVVSSWDCKWCGKVFRQFGDLNFEDKRECPLCGSPLSFMAVVIRNKEGN